MELKCSAVLHCSKTKEIDATQANKPEQSACIFFNELPPKPNFIWWDTALTLWLLLALPTSHLKSLLLPPAIPFLIKWLWESFLDFTTSLFYSLIVLGDTQKPVSADRRILGGKPPGWNPGVEKKKASYHRKKDDWCTIKVGEDFKWPIPFFPSVVLPACLPFHSSFRL